MTDKTKLLILIGFNFSLMVLEVAGGIISGSLALISDAGHMLVDTTALLTSYVAVFISGRLPTRQKTFGYKRAEVLAALFNGALLSGLAMFVFYEAVIRLWHPHEIKTLTMLVVAVIGLLGNVGGIFLLKENSVAHRHRHSDAPTDAAMNFSDKKSVIDTAAPKNINIKGAYYHILSDTLSSMAVVSGALTIRLTGFSRIDSILGMLISGFMIKNGFNLLKESLDILMESTPPDIDISDLSSEIAASVSGVKNFHDVHIWSISTDRRALSAHVELKEDINVSGAQDRILCDIRKILSERYNIYHTTLEVECGGCYYHNGGGGDKGICYL